MLITDYSEQEFIRPSLRGGISTKQSIPFLPELLTAGMIFILPIIFLLIISAH